MHCEFCNKALPDADPENIALLNHVARSEPCAEGYDHLLQNLNTSWTLNMSGG
jgi:hypothetical protein